jgi:hypothetical protein
MTAAETRLAVERAIIELSDIDQGLTLMVSGLRSRVRTALGQLTSVRSTLDARAEEVRVMLEEQARDDAETARDDDELRTDKPEDWFNSWLADTACEHGVEPLTEDEARAVYVAAFERARREAGHA